MMAGESTPGVVGQDRGGRWKNKRGKTNGIMGNQRYSLDYFFHFKIKREKVVALE